MPYSSTRGWIQALDAAGELIRISDPASTELEITAIADRQMKSLDGGKALLFEQPLLGNRMPSDIPLLINALGSARRMAMALGSPSLDEPVERITGLLKARPPTSLVEAFALLQQAMELRHAKPQTVSTGPCQEVIHRPADGNFSLRNLPILKCWPEDGGPFVTLPIVVTRDPDTGAYNWGMYRMQVFDGWTTGMHWQVHKVGARHARRYAERGERMPVAVAIGGDPVQTFAATAPLPDGIDEALFAGFLRQKSIHLVKCETCDLAVPADADLVLEGYVQPGETRPEGPFGDHTGFYTTVEPYPVFHVECITRRKDAVYPATIVGKPPMEDFHIGSALVRILLPILKATFPEIVDIAMPAEGVFHNLVFVSLRKQYPHQAFKVMNGLWGMGQMMFSKIIVAVDDGVDVHNTSDVLFHLGANIDPQRDIVFTKGPCDSLDHAPSRPNVGSHMGIDATAKLRGEGYPRDWPREIRMDPAVIQRIQRILSAR